jgi:hypothetical protein
MPPLRGSEAAHRFGSAIPQRGFELDREDWDSMMGAR